MNTVRSKDVSQSNGASLYRISEFKNSKRDKKVPEHWEFEDYNESCNYGAHKDREVKKSSIHYRGKQLYNELTRFRHHWKNLNISYEQASQAARKGTPEDVWQPKQNEDWQSSSSLQEAPSRNETIKKNDMIISDDRKKSIRDLISVIIDCPLHQYEWGYKENLFRTQMKKEENQMRDYEFTFAAKEIRNNKQLENEQEKEKVINILRGYTSHGSGASQYYGE